MHIEFKNDDKAVAHSIGVDQRTGEFPPRWRTRSRCSPRQSAASRPTRRGVSPGKSETVNFKAATPGHYSLVCYMPGHAAAGMWVRFDVDARYYGRGAERFPAVTLVTAGRWRRSHRTSDGSLTWSRREEVAARWARMLIPFTAVRSVGYALAVAISLIASSTGCGARHEPDGGRHPIRARLLPSPSTTTTGWMPSCSFTTMAKRRGSGPSLRRRAHTSSSRRGCWVRPATFAWPLTPSGRPGRSIPTADPRPTRSVHRVAAGERARYLDRRGLLIFSAGRAAGQGASLLA